MKKTLILLFTVLIMLSLALVANAQEITTNNGEAGAGDEVFSIPLKQYIEEKILPIMVGVVTSIIALLSTLKGVFSALKGLKESKIQLDTDREKIKAESQRELEKITEKYGEIKKELERIYLIEPEIKALKEKADNLTKAIVNMSNIASIGFSQSKELVSEGKAREIVILADKNGELIDNEAI